MRSNFVDIPNFRTVRDLGREWFLLPIGVGVGAKFFSFLVLWALLRFASPEVGKEALSNDSFSVIAKQTDPNFIYYSFITLIASPLIENILIILSVEWLRRGGAILTGVGVTIVSVVAFVIHGADLSSTAPAVAFAIYALYYSWMRSIGNTVFGSFFKTALAHSVSNMIALGFWLS